MSKALGMSRPLRVARSSKFVRSRHIMITQGMRYSSSLSHGDSRAFAQTESAPTFRSISHHSPGPEALSHDMPSHQAQARQKTGGEYKPSQTALPREPAKLQSPPDHGKTNDVRTVLYMYGCLGGLLRAHPVTGATFIMYVDVYSIITMHSFLLCSYSVE